MSAFLPRFLWTFAVLLLLIVLGTLGYVLIEAPSFADALYMTVITLTAVGYQEVFDLTPPGRSFTMILLLCGISWMGLWFANITSFIVELDLKDALKRRRNMQDIANMRDHVIICGAGSNSSLNTFPTLTFWRATQPMTTCLWRRGSCTQEASSRV